MKSNLSIEFYNTIALNNEREKIDNLISNTKRHIETVKNLLSRITSNPHTSKSITVSIIVVIILFFVGIIFPVAYLPAEEGFDFTYDKIDFFIPEFFTPKGVLMMIISVIFLFVMIFFMMINFSLKYGSGKIKTLEYYSNINNYSEYFNILFEENMSYSS